MLNWGTLRPGLLADLGFTSAQELADTIGFVNVDDIERALAGEPPTDELMSALLRHYLTTPLLYFVTSTAAEPAA